MGAFAYFGFAAVHRHCCDLEFDVEKEKQQSKKDCALGVCGAYFAV